MPNDPPINIPITNSEPPSVRLVAARGAAFQMVIAQFAELIGLVAITFALVQGKLGEQTFAYLFCGCLSGRFAQQVGSAIRGKPVQPLPTTTLVAAVLVFCALLQSCAGTRLHEPDWAQVRQDANDMRTAVNEAVDEAQNEGVPKLLAVCAVAGEQSKVCTSLRNGYDIARGAVGAARKAIDLYDETGIAGQDVHVAVARVQALADEFNDAAQSALEVVQHETLARDREPGDGSTEPVSPTETGPGTAEGGGPPNAAAPANAVSPPPTGAP